MDANTVSSIIAWTSELEGLPPPWTGSPLSAEQATLASVEGEFLLSFDSPATANTSGSGATSTANTTATNEEEERVRKKHSLSDDDRAADEQQKTRQKRKPTKRTKQTRLQQSRKTQKKKKKKKEPQQPHGGGEQLAVRKPKPTQAVAPVEPKVRHTWTAEEDEQLLALYKSCGPKWAYIARQLPQMVGSQVRERFVQHLDPQLNLQQWTPDEDLRLLRLVQMYAASTAAVVVGIFVAVVAC